MIIAAFLNLLNPHDSQLHLVYLGFFFLFLSLIKKISFWGISTKFLCGIQMAPDPIGQEFERTCSMDFFKKVKRFRLFEPSLGILGFFLVTVCVIFGFFFLDYKTVIKGPVFSVQSERLQWLRLDGSSEKRVKKVDFMSENGGGCNLFEGEWIWDDSYPLYQSRDCRFLDDGFKCTENGRPDKFYTKWRWEPKDCNLPR